MGMYVPVVGVLVPYFTFKCSIYSCVIHSLERRNEFFGMDFQRMHRDDDDDGKDDRATRTRVRGVREGLVRTVS